MAQNQDKRAFIESKLCIKCTTMYGHPNFNDMCSVCFKKEKTQQKIQELKKDEPQHHEEKLQTVEEKVKPQCDIDPKKRVSTANAVQEKAAGRCTKCERKTNLLGYNCKHCSGEFCRLHRLPQEHQCEVDFISLGRKQIKTDNPIVSKNKIEHI